MKQKMKFVCFVCLFCVAAGARADLQINAGTSTNDTVNNVTVQYILDTAGTISLGTVTGATVPTISTWRTPSGNSGWTVPGSFLVNFDGRQNIDRTTGAAISATSQNMTANTRGLGVAAGAAGNFIGSNATLTEGLIISADTTNLPSSLALKLVSATLDAVSGSDALDNAQVVSRLAGHAATPVVDYPDPENQLAIDLSALNIILDGGTPMTQLATFFEPALNAHGWRVNHFTFAVVRGGGIQALNPKDGDAVSASPVHFNWTFGGDAVVTGYTFVLSTDPNLLNASARLVSPTAVAPQKSAPANPVAPQSDPNGFYTYNGAIALDTNYYWGVTATVMDPNDNFRLSIPEPNSVYNIPRTVSSLFTFSGPQSKPTLTNPANVLLFPDSYTLQYTAPAAEFTVGITSGFAVDTSNTQWYKQAGEAQDPGSDTPINTGGPYTVTTGNTETKLAINPASTAENGLYYADVHLVGAGSAMSGSAKLDMRYILRHRYSFSGNTTDTGNLPLNATIVDNLGGHTSYADGKELRITHPVDSGDPNAAHVDLANGIISDMTNWTTIVFWATWEDPLIFDPNTNFTRVFDFGVPASGIEGETTGGGNTQSLFYAAANGSDIPTMIARSSDNGTIYTVFTGTPWRETNGAEICAALVWDGGNPATTQNATLTAYLNGVPVGSSTSLADGRTLADLVDLNNWLGRSQYAADRIFNGKYNEFRIYDVALSGAWIYGIAKAGPDEANFANMIPCDEFPEFDTNDDCVTDLEDFAEFANDWLNSGLRQ